ncbi:MAG: FumA C-terminus/TtdB family hydratase beta subunit [Candidatus Kaelpia aquatica]|nr:FumA C-terminus/TtdB family hydratase beta subunit [Candidatus Kaelpia aquatica]
MNIESPLTAGIIKSLKAGELVYLSGAIYTARDKAHKKIFDLIDKGRELPFNLKDSIIYYCGPAPKKRGEAIGSCGPTTSSRMDKHTPLLYELGLGATIGKGERGEDVVDAVKKYKGVYFLAWGGCGAYLSSFVKSSKIIAFKELGAEAIRRLEVERFPLVVAVDSYGNKIWDKRGKK